MHPDDLFGPGSPIRVIGHRGAAAAAPENTLPSFLRAVRAGADAVELDLHCSRDGHLVVVHDDTLERTTDGTGPVEALDLAVLRQLDAGHGFTPDGGRSFPFRGQDVRIPTFEEVLEATGERPIVAEVKSLRAGEALASWLETDPGRDRILVGGFSLEAVESARRRAHWSCAYTSELRRYVLLGKVGLAALAVPDVNAVMVPPRRRLLRVVTPRFVRRAHRDGLGVFVWTINHPRTIRRLLDWGVDGLVSDVPGRVRRILDERAARG